MKRDGERRKGPSYTSLVVFFLFVLPLAYVLSYAPVYRFATEPYIDESGLQWFDPREDWERLYRPVDWLTDNTPLREPLLLWAGLWGEHVEKSIRFHSILRIGGEDPL